MASQTFLYEILARFGPDGFVGAHAIDLRRLVDDDDGEVHDKLLDARPITEKEFKGYLGDTAKLVEAADRARAKTEEVRAAAREEIERVNKEAAEREAALTAERDEAKAIAAAAERAQEKADRRTESALELVEKLKIEVASKHDALERGSKVAEQLRAENTRLKKPNRPGRRRKATNAD